MAFTQVSNGGLASGSVTLTSCDWYSPDANADTGAIKLPAGSTSERPTVVQGGREVVTFDLTVSQPDLEHSDPSFNMMDPWLWSWESNYNRANPATDQQDPTITLLRGSTYYFRNFTVGHSLWLKSQALSQAEYDAGNVDLYKLGTSDGVTNNGTKRVVGSSDPAVISWTVPLDYPHNSVTIQHSQYGMDDTIIVTDPPAGTLGYIRLNTDLGTDQATKTGLEFYTGNGWKSVAISGGAGTIIDHPVDTLTTEVFGLITDSITTSEAFGAITDSITLTSVYGGLSLYAFGADGSVSVNSDYSVVSHDGSTVNGIPMLRADGANIPDNLQNKKTWFASITSQTLTDCDVSGSITSRIAFGTPISQSGVTLEDDSKRIRFTKNTTNAYYEFTLKIKLPADGQIQFWKNSSLISNSVYDIKANYHHTVSWVDKASFDDTFEIRVSSSTGSNSINTTNSLKIDFLGT